MFSKGKEEKEVINMVLFSNVHMSFFSSSSSFEYVSGLGSLVNLTLSHIRAIGHMDTYLGLIGAYLQYIGVILLIF